MSVNQIAKIESVTSNAQGELTGYSVDAEAIYSFDGLIGRVVTTEDRVEVLRHTGIAGHTLRFMPQSAEPFDIVEHLHLTDIEDWLPLLRLYQKNLMKAEHGVAMLRYGTELLWPLDVLSVQKIGVVSRSGGVGTLVDLASGTVGAYAEFRFRMIARSLT